MPARQRAKVTLAIESLATQVPDLLEEIQD